MVVQRREGFGIKGGYEHGWETGFIIVVIVRQKLNFVELPFLFKDINAIIWSDPVYCEVVGVPIQSFFGRVYELRFVDCKIILDLLAFNKLPA